MKFNYKFYAFNLFALFAANLSAHSSASDTGTYRGCCQKAVEDDAFFEQFKWPHPYRQILEHLGGPHGRMYLDVIKHQTPWLLDHLDDFLKNDLIGRPHELTFYEETGMISPTTLRYMKVASDLQLLFGSCLNDKSIIEIGGGYGGQCLVLSFICKFKNYTIVDLPEPLALTKKYLERHHIHNVTYKRFDEVIPDQTFDLVISNYAYTECSDEMREKYIREILKRSKRGYFTGLGELLVQDFERHKIAYEKFPENPCTGSSNALVIWR